MVSSEKQVIPVKELLFIEGNNACFDCSSTKVAWANCTFGVFLCLECALNHKDYFENNHSQIKSLETPHWNEYDYLVMKIGGNNSLSCYLKHYEIEVNTQDLTAKYLNKAVDYYTRFLKASAEGKDITEKRPTKEEGAKLLEKKKDFKQRVSEMYHAGVETTSKITSDLNRDYQKTKEALGRQINDGYAYTSEKTRTLKDGACDIGKNIADSVGSTLGKLGGFFASQKSDNKEEVHVEADAEVSVSSNEHTESKGEN
jgi:hypothetical protein